MMIPNTNIVGFIGPIGSGKTLASDYLVKKGYVKLPYKKALIEEAQKKFPMLTAKLSSIHGVEIKKIFNKPYLDEIRCLLQDYGQMKRDEQQDYWVNKWLLRYDPAYKIVIDDVRYRNEADNIIRGNGILIRLQRKGLEKVVHHQSEKERNKITPDATIENNGTVEDFFKKVDKTIEKIEKKNENNNNK